MTHTQLPTSENHEEEDDDDLQQLEALGIPSEVAERIPVAAREFLSLAVSTSMQTNRVDPIASKLTDEHLTKLIENSRQTAKDAHENQREQNKQIFWIVIFALIVLTVLVIAALAWEKLDILVPLAQYLIAASLGAAGGYGVGRSRAKPQPHSPVDDE